VSERVRVHPGNGATVQHLHAPADDEAMEVRSRFAHHGTVVGDDDVWAALQVEINLEYWRAALEAVYRGEATFVVSNGGVRVLPRGRPS
jgi:hypothetical protein